MCWARCLASRGAGRSSGGTGHAAAAFTAARAIQEGIVAQALHSVGAKQPYFPVRIGINTAEVTIGNLGGGEYVDFSIIGGGVNFASRLEAACSPFKIVLSEASKTQIEEVLPDTVQFDEVLIAVKHHRDLIKAYEFDPFLSRPGVVRKAEESYLDFLDIRPMETRYRVKTTGLIGLSAAFGSFVVLDYSRHGFAALGERFIGQNTLVDLDLSLASETAMMALRGKLLGRICLEVRWSRRAPGGFLHGMKIRGLNEGQIDFLFATMAQVAGLEELATPTGALQRAN